MMRDAMVTGAGLPVVRPFVAQLLSHKLRSLTLCGDPIDLEACCDVVLQSQKEQAPNTNLRFCSFSGSLDLPSLNGVWDRGASPLLLHGRTRRSAALAQSNPCDAVHQNLLLTRQLLQLIIPTSASGAFVFLSSDLALQRDTVLGATFAAAEASVLEAARLCPRLAMAVVRFPARLDPIRLDGLPLELAWRQQLVARAAVQAFATDQRQLLLSWPDPIAAPQQLQCQPLAQALPSPRVPLIHWLSQISSPLQNYDNGTVARALLDLWR